MQQYVYCTFFFLGVPQLGYCTFYEVCYDSYFLFLAYYERGTVPILSLSSHTISDYRGLLDCIDRPPNIVGKRLHYSAYSTVGLPRCYSSCTYSRPRQGFAHDTVKLSFYSFKAVNKPQVEEKSFKKKTPPSLPPSLPPCPRLCQYISPLVDFLSAG